ncbi:DUF3592 domain-containing protein [Flavobacterium sp. FlaQc-52]|jgi:hypothetical protein|uniref:DUF3592 domain-containing protein n=1 Tax=Flavobacterium sp. FlaQc-52 TaxID=3374185 RepID=UPI003757992D
MNLNKEQSLIFVILFIFFMFYKPAICFLMIGILLLFYAYSSISFLNQIKKNGIESFGKILSYESDNDGYKTPFIEFLTTEGKNITGKPFLHTSSDLDKFQSYQENINKTITIRYNPEDPEKFVIENNFNGLGSLLLIIIGLLFTGISVASLLGFIDAF